jgi:hypothetical protein
MSARAAALKDLVDRRDIGAVLTRYSRALDRADLDLMKSVYWHDGVDNHGVFNGNAAAFCEFIIREIRNWFEVTTHNLLNVRIDVDGDHAAAETIHYAYHKVRAEKVDEIFGARYLTMFDRKSLDREHHVFYAGARYVDLLSRRDGEWRILRRQVVSDWNDNGPSGEVLDQGMPATLHPRGRRDPSDLVFSNIGAR